MRHFDSSPDSRKRIPRLALPGTSQRPDAVTRRSLLLVLFAWLSTIALHEIDLGGEWDPVSFRTWSLLAAWLACFAAAYQIVLALLRRRPTPLADAPHLGWVNAWVTALSMAAAMGALLIIFDFAILRGYGFDTAVAAIRTEEIRDFKQGAVQSSAVSGIGRLMIPAILPAYLLSVCCWADLNGKTRIIMAAGSIVLIAEQTQFEGGRFFLTAVALTCVLCYFMYPCPQSRQKQIAVTKRKIPFIRMALLTAIMMSFFSYVFVDRILQRDDFFWTAYLETATAYALDINYQGAGWFEGAFGPLWYSMCMLWLYITQGLSQVDVLLSLTYLEHAHGFYQVPHLAQIAWIGFGVDLRYDIIANLPTAGTYVTFYGFNYIDFGNFGAIISGVILGGVTARSIHGFSGGRLDWVSIQAPILLIICLFSPIISLVPNLWAAMAWAVVVAASGGKRS